jgi:hypothetical protein
MVDLQTRNPNLGKFLEVLAMEDVVRFCGHWVNFPALWYILRPFGKCYGHLVYFSPFWYVLSRKIWQPCSICTFPLTKYVGISHESCRSLVRCPEKPKILVFKKYLTNSVFRFFSRYVLTYLPTMHFKMADVQLHFLGLKRFGFFANSCQDFLQEPIIRTITTYLQRL